jgi:hypothetical protein
MIWDPNNKHRRSRVRALVAARWRAQRRAEQTKSDGADIADKKDSTSLSDKPKISPEARARALADIGLGVIGFFLFLLLVAFIIAV